MQTNHETTMDIRRIEQIETNDSSEETLQLTNRWKELVKHGEYTTSNGVLKKYNPPRHHRAERKRVEMNLIQRRNRLLWNRMEEQEKKPEESNRVVEKKRNMPQKEIGELSGTNEDTQEAENPLKTIETESTRSVETFGVPAIIFKKYLGTTGKRYIQMGQASHIQNEKKWDLKETIKQAEQKLTTDLKTIATETTNDEKLLKTLVCLERRTSEQIPEEYKPYQKQLSTRSGVVFYEDRIIFSKAQRTTIIMLSCSYTKETRPSTR